MVSSKLTVKNQTTIPKEIRNALQIKAGDRVFFEIRSNNEVVICKAQPFDYEFTKSLESTLNEWESDDDNKNYGNL